MDLEGARNLINGLSGDQALRCRMTLGRAGQLDLVTVQMDARPVTGWNVAIAKQRLNSDDIWLRYKTTKRVQYDQARANLPAGVDEYIFVNEREEVCEGTITNIFVKTAQGSLGTPPLRSGLLPGVKRQSMLANEGCKEQVVTLDDLHQAQQILMGNSLRGLIPATLI
jgi:4-amino-4-deoxychorismate lyase